MTGATEEGLNAGRAPRHRVKDGIQEASSLGGRTTAGRVRVGATCACLGNGRCSGVQTQPGFGSRFRRLAPRDLGCTRVHLRALGRLSRPCGVAGRRERPCGPENLGQRLAHRGCSVSARRRRRRGRGTSLRRARREGDGEGDKSLPTFTLKPLAACPGAGAPQPACLNRIGCNSTQPGADPPAGHGMKGVVLPSGQVLN